MGHSEEPGRKPFGAPPVDPPSQPGRRRSPTRVRAARSARACAARRRRLRPGQPVGGALQPGCAAVGEGAQPGDVAGDRRGPALRVPLELLGAAHQAAGADAVGRRLPQHGLLVAADVVEVGAGDERVVQRAGAAAEREDDVVGRGVAVGRGDERRRAGRGCRRPRSRPAAAARRAEAARRSTAVRRARSASSRRVPATRVAVARRASARRAVTSAAGAGHRVRGRQGRRGRRPPAGRAPAPTQGTARIVRRR